MEIQKTSVRLLVDHLCVYQGLDLKDAHHHYKWQEQLRDYYFSLYNLQ